MFYSDKNDLRINGKVKKLTKLKLKVLKDSTNKTYYDTIFIEKTTLNRKGKLKKRTTKQFFRGKLSHSGIADFEYNNNGQLAIENYYTILDSTNIRVEYHYNDTLISKIKSITYYETERNDFEENYFYRPNNKLKYRELKSITIDTIRKDTVYKQFTKFIHDENGYLVESDWTSSIEDFDKKEIYVNNRKGFVKELISINRYNSKIDTIRYEYEFDDKDNWILTKEFIKDSLVEITKRIIE
jgi:hypothetical protein